MKIIKQIILTLLMLSSSCFALNPLPTGFDNVVSPYINVLYPSSNAKISIIAEWITKDGRTWILIQSNSGEWSHGYHVDVKINTTSTGIYSIRDDFHIASDLDFFISKVMDLDGNPVILNKKYYYYPLDVSKFVDFGEKFHVMLDCVEVGGGHDTEGDCSMLLENHALLTVRCHYGSTNTVVEKAQVLTQIGQRLEYPQYMDKPEGIWVITNILVDDISVEIQPNDGAYVNPQLNKITIIDYLFKEIIPEPLIAEFTLSLDNTRLENMKMWAKGIEPGDMIFINGAKTYADAKAGNWVAIPDSYVLVDTLTFDYHQISIYPDVEIDTDEYKFFKPYILKWNSKIYPGCKFVGVVDVTRDFYGETAVGIPFVTCLSEYKEEINWVDADMRLNTLIQTNSTYNDDIVYFQNGTTLTQTTTPLDNIIPLVRGSGFVVKSANSGIIRLHGQINETQADWKLDELDDVTMISNGLPDDLNLNYFTYGVPGSDDATITYMDENDFTYVLYFGEVNGVQKWYRTKTIIKKGKRTTSKIDPPIIKSGRIIWYNNGNSPATPIVIKAGNDI